MGLGWRTKWGGVHWVGRTTARTSVEYSGPLLGVPAKSADRGHTPAQKPEPSWRVLLAETPSQRQVPRRTMMQCQHTGEGQANTGARFPGQSVDLAFLLLTLSAPFSLGLYFVHLKVSAFIVTTYWTVLSKDTSKTALSLNGTQYPSNNKVFISLAATNVLPKFVHAHTHNYTHTLVLYWKINTSLPTFSAIYSTVHILSFLLCGTICCGNKWCFS